MIYQVCQLLLHEVKLALTQTCIRWCVQTTCERISLFFSLCRLLPLPESIVQQPWCSPWPWHAAFYLHVAPAGGPWHPAGAPHRVAAPRVPRQTFGVQFPHPHWHTPHHLVSHLIPLVRMKIWHYCWNVLPVPAVCTVAAGTSVWFEFSLHQSGWRWFGNRVSTITKTPSLCLHKPGNIRVRQAESGI